MVFSCSACQKVLEGHGFIHFHSIAITKARCPLPLPGHAKWAEELWPGRAAAEDPTEMIFGKFQTAYGSLQRI